MPSGSTCLLRGGSHHGRRFPALGPREAAVIFMLHGDFAPPSPLCRCHIRATALERYDYVGCQDGTRHYRAAPPVAEPLGARRALPPTASSAAVPAELLEVSAAWPETSPFALPPPSTG